MYDVLIIGGGLAGLTSAIQLSNKGLKTMLVEKREYPFHRVCGEYISNEVKPFLKSIGADVEELSPSNIQKLVVTSPYGTTLNTSLDLGGFGVSRYTLDNFLYTLALKKGCEVKLNTQVEDIVFENNIFYSKLSDGSEIISAIVIGSYGKRSNLDRKFNRKFFYRRSPYIGVKYHIKTDFPKDMIALHNFRNGYCGISAIEDDKYCFCYLTTRDNLKKHHSVEEMEVAVLYKNPFLKNIFSNSSFIFPKPEIINEISFETKSPIENHLLMVGDAAGMIAPLCGNGMSMAIHASKLVADCIVKHYSKDDFSRKKLEEEYTQLWNKHFLKRLYIGKKIQDLFGRERITDSVIRTLKLIPPLTNYLVKQTHGKEI